MKGKSLLIFLVSLLRSPQNDSDLLTIQHHHSSPQRSIFSTPETMSMSQISITGSPGSPNLHSKNKLIDR